MVASAELITIAQPITVAGPVANTKSVSTARRIAVARLARRLILKFGGMGGVGALASTSIDGQKHAGLNAYAPGSLADFDRLYRSSFPRVVRTLASIVGSQAAAEDCAQEAFTRALRAWPRWHGDVPAEAWLHRIAVNTAISYRRHEKIRALPSLLLRLGVPRAHDDPAEWAESRSLVAELRRLPPKQSAAVVLRYYHGYTNREIAAAVGVSERTVGQRIADALAILRKRIEAGGR